MTSAAINTEALAPTFVHALANGLTLLVRENHEVAVATADVWVGTGSASETPEVGGISHFLEHMLFKGTENFGLGQIEREIENYGGMTNAGTSYDFTHYYLTMPAENIERGVHMLSEMVIHSVVDPGELEKERLVILEEYRRKQDNPGAMLFEDLFEQLYTTGPYHRPVIGTEETIRSITREQMVDYYRRHYAPANAALVLVGDIERDRAIELAEQYFGGFEREYDPLLEEVETTKLASAVDHHRDKTTGGEVYYALACGAPAAGEIEKAVPLDVAQFILGEGRASLLFQEIKERRRLASTISCYYSTQRHASLFAIDATCEPAKRAELGAAVRELVERFAAEPINAGQLNRAKRLLASGHLFSFETTGSASVQTGYYHTLTGSTDFLDDYLRRLDGITADDVQTAIRGLLADYEWNECSVGPKS